jgi:hypothetical protein
VTERSSSPELSLKVSPRSHRLPQHPSQSLCPRPGLARERCRCRRSPPETYGVSFGSRAIDGLGWVAVANDATVEEGQAEPFFLAYWMVTEAGLERSTKAMWGCMVW